MAEHLEYIDSYFNKELSDEERRQFDQRIEQDPAFAEEVAFYLHTLQSIQSQAAAERKQRFRGIYEESKSAPRSVPLVRKLWPYVAAAAAILIVVMGIYLFQSPAATPLELADEYIAGALKELSPSMGAADSVENAKSLYNRGQYTEAQRMFETIISRDSLQTEAIKFAGIVSLRLGEYDKSIQFFTQLENTRLQENYGKFYHALVLMKRNIERDQAEAKQLLTEVVEKNLAGKDTAKKWLDKWQQ